MFYALAILAAIAMAGAVIGAAMYYLERDKLCTRQRQANQFLQEQFLQEQTKRFRAALQLRLRKKGIAGLDFDRLVEENEVPVEIARQTAAGLYAHFSKQALADAQITEAERRKLDALRHALAIPTEVATAIEANARDERYRGVALNALADGKITKEEAAELEWLRTSLGLSVRQASEIVGTPVREGYLALFRRVISDGRITPEELEELRRYREALGIARGEANDIVRDEVIGLYRHWFSNAIQDGAVTAEEEQGLAWLRDEFGLDARVTQAYEAQLQEVKQLAAYRQGNLPTVRTGKLLEGGEICHWEGRCRFQWETATQVKQADGDLIITSEQLVFSSPLRSFSLSPSKIVDITLYSDALVIGTASSRGAGTYFVRQPRELEAILIGLTRRHKYQFSESFSSSLSRHIPDSVRREVWQRDGGRCVRCSAVDYLEFDHILPHSRGGANTVANVQILCRRCNNLKSDRI